MPNATPPSHIGRADEAYVTVQSALSRSPELFDEHWYLGQLEEGTEGETDAFQHFMRVGRALNLSPGPWLDPQWYWGNYPDVAGVLPAVDHYVLYGEREGRQPHPHFVPRLSLFPFPETYAPLNLTASAWRAAVSGIDVTDPDWLLAELASAEDVEPQLARVTRQRLLDAVPGIHGNAKAAYISRVLDALVPNSLLVVVANFSPGPELRAAADTANAAAEVLGPGRVCAISTDGAGSGSAAWFSKGITVRSMQVTLANKLDNKESSGMFAQVLMSSHPQMVANFGSRLCWRAYLDYAHALSKHMSLSASSLSYKDASDRANAPDLRAVIQYLACVMLDDETVQHDLVHRLALLPTDVPKLVITHHQDGTLRTKPSALVELLLGEPQGLTADTPTQQPG